MSLNAGKTLEMFETAHIMKKRLRLSNKFELPRALPALFSHSHGMPSSTRNIISRRMHCPRAMLTSAK